MRIKYLLFWLLLLGLALPGAAQRFHNRNLYDIWLSAHEFLNDGEFDRALKLFGAAPEIPEFARRIESTRQIQLVYQNGERYYRARKYAEALEYYSKYRAIDKRLSVQAIEDRIQSCLRQLDKVLLRKLDESTRVVAGFEYAYKGDRQLALLDTAAAQKSFLKAKQVGGTFNATLRDQYQEGLQSVKALRQWGEAYQEALAGNDKREQLESLRKYRQASRYIVSSLEYEIKSAEEGENTILPTTSDSGVTARLVKYANECRVEDLYFFVQSNPTSFADSDSLAATITRYRAIEKDLAAIPHVAENSFLLESIYRKLIQSAAPIPAIGAKLQVCARQKYFDYLLPRIMVYKTLGTAEEDLEAYHLIGRYLAEASLLEEDVFQQPLQSVQKEIAGKLNCQVLLTEFTRAATLVRSELSGCQVQSARRVWEQALARAGACPSIDPHFLVPFSTLRDSVYTLFRADSLFTVLTVRANSALTDRSCTEARQLYQQLADLPLCDPALRDRIVADAMPRLAECDRVLCYLTSRGKALEYAQNREWKKSYDAYEQALACALPDQQARIEQIMADMRCDAYPERCRTGNVAVSLEPTARLAFNHPKYIEDGKSKPTTSGYFNSAGLQAAFLSYLNPLDVVLGVEYFQTHYQALGTPLGTGFAAGTFDISGLDTYLALKLHKVGVDPNRLRPYLKGGLEMIFPTRYSQKNHYVHESTTDRSLLKKQSLGLLGGVGVELQRKKFGFSVEVLGSYNFSGIYNSNAVSSSGSRGETEAYFRTVGIRAGIRFW